MLRLTRSLIFIAAILLATMGLGCGSSDDDGGPDQTANPSTNGTDPTGTSNTAQEPGGDTTALGGTDTTAPSGSDPGAAATGSGSVCGNNKKEDGEECDGDDFGGATCASFIPNTEGTLSCINCIVDNNQCWEIEVDVPDAEVDSYGG